MLVRLNTYQMDKYTYENWVRVKATFEESGNTDNLFYQKPVRL